MMATTPVVLGGHYFVNPTNLIVIEVNNILVEETLLLGWASPERWFLI